MSAWTENDLVNAMREVNDGAFVSGTAKKYGIPRRTLRNHVISGSLHKRVGRQTVLTTEQENELCERIFRLSQIDVPLTSKIVKTSVYKFCEENKISHPFDQTKKRAGRKWLNLFLQRHPNISIRKHKTLNPGRADKLNQVVFNDYFQKLRNLILQLDVGAKPHNIYNMDEKECSLMLYKAQSVLAEKGAKQVSSVGNKNRENVTIVGCGNAAGQFIPPVILFKGKRRNEALETNLPPGAKVFMTEEGSMTTEILVRWLEHFEKFRQKGPTLLIFNGASWHLDYTITDTADKYGITLFCLPSNCTPYLQPLNRCVFRAFENYWDEAIANHMVSSNERVITKKHFGKLFSFAWHSSITPNNLMSGFKTTGIYPFDPNQIPHDAFLSSTLTQGVTQPNVENDPGPSLSSPTSQRIEINPSTSSDVSNLLFGITSGFTFGENFSYSRSDEESY